MSIAAPTADPRVVAVVVTMNRRDLLAECLEALGAQSREIEEVIVVDNASTDGTPAMVRGEFGWATLVELAENVGGAGGFHTGLGAACERGADWVWLLDDDTVARSDALERLLDASAPVDGLPAPSVLASRVEWRDGRAHPMNLPILKRRDLPHLVASAERRLAPLRCATFVSLLVARSAVERHGLPHAEFFIWADDVEFTARILRDEHGYLVPTSVVTHKTRHPHSSVAHAGDRFYYHVRNNLFMLRGPAWSPTEKPALAWALLSTTFTYLRARRFHPRGLALVLRAVRDGRRRPRRPTMLDGPSTRP